MVKANINETRKQTIVSSQFLKEEKYWQKKLSGQDEKTSFPYDHRRKTNQRRYEQVKFNFPGDLFSRLMKLRNGSDYRMHMILVAGLIVLLHRYTGKTDIVVGSPVIRQDDEAEFINTALVLRNPIESTMTFKELLLQVRQTVVEAEENHNYPVTLLPERLGIPFPENNDFPLFDIGILLENIHDKRYFEKINFNMTFSFLRTDQQVEGAVEYNSMLYDKQTIEKIIASFTVLMQEILFNIHRQLVDFDGLTEEEKNQLLFEFNNTMKSYLPGKTVVDLFEEQVEKSPGAAAFTYNIDVEDLFNQFNSGKSDPRLVDILGMCCFRKNDYLHRFENTTLLERLLLEEKEKRELTLFKTHRKNVAAINHTVLKILGFFTGKHNLWSIFQGIREKLLTFLVIDLNVNDLSRFNSYTFIIKTFADFIYFTKLLHQLNLIDLIGQQPGETQLDIAINAPGTKEIKRDLNQSFKKDVPVNSFETSTSSGSRVNRVLILGGSPGTAAIGVVYLASFLRRNGIEAYCQWNCIAKTKARLKENIKTLLQRLQPQVVAVSMKWFPHIARALEICKMVKRHSPSIKVVVGGNTAAHYWQNIIRYEYIDYIVLGDGEVPLMKICKNENEKEIPNIVYKDKKSGEIIHTGINYVQDEQNSSDIFLSHLDEIFVEKEDPYIADAFLVYTGKGCSMSCFYCGGCLEAQKSDFNRNKPFLRRIQEVRKDLIEARKYNSTFMFDFDLSWHDILDYYKEILAGIDLSDHFCDIYLWRIPSPGLLELISKSFKYVYLNIDVGSLSETHRMKLAALRVVKPQSTDKELFNFLDRCEKQRNIEVIIDLIAGLPYFSEKDINKSNDVFKKLMHYNCFTKIAWGRLHAQPGAPLTRNSEKYGMISYAKTYDDFLKYSELNFKEEVYPDLTTTYYPYIYSKDNDLNSKITKHYFETEEKLKEPRNKGYKQDHLENSIHLTYEQFNRKSNQLARILRSRGIGADTITGIMVQNPEKMVLGIMAILKAAGAYLPIDPQYPRERIKYIMENSGTQILVTDQKGNFGDNISTIVDITDTSIYLETGDANLEKTIRPTDAAYVIYTSGTSGRPKGVVVEHRNTANTLLSRKAAYKMTPADTSLQLFSYSFDGFVTSFFTPLVSGSKVVLMDENEVKDVTRIKRTIVKNRITHFISVPVLFTAIIEALTPEEAANLKVVTLAGDQVSPGSIELAKGRNKNIQIVNEYGVTEAAVMSTISRHLEKQNRITIGMPIWNTKIYILDQGKRLQPIGVPGELCIAGAGVARGYLNNPELTAQKFHIFNHRWYYKSYRSNQSYILYKTGDLARWLPDGNIQLLGRLDNQVKIRGYRIELSEIESQLKKFKKIKDAVVIQNDDANRKKYLHAYMVAITNEQLNASEIREFLLMNFPDYMVPSHFSQLQNMPLTPQGKIDRRKIPNLTEVKKIDNEDEYIVPRNEIEKELVEIWCKMLDLKDISVKSNFFNSGGDSIKSISLLNLLNERFKTTLKLLDLYENNTIENLAHLLENEINGSATGTDIHTGEEYQEVREEIKNLKDDYLRELKTEENNGLEINIEDVYPMSDIQKGMVYYSLKNPGIYHNQIIFQRKYKDFNPVIFKRAIALLVEKHPILRTHFNMFDFKEPLQIIFKRISPDIEHEDISHMEKSEQEKYVQSILALDREKPFDIRVPGPMWRVKTFAVSDKNICFIWICHHAVMDGWSNASLMTELNNTYLGLRTNPPVTPVDPGKLKNTYKEFVIEQMLENRKSETTAYWQKKLKDYKRLDFSYFALESNHNKHNQIKRKTYNLGEQLLEKLNAAAEKYSTTVKNLCFGAYVYMLNMLSYENDILVGLVTDNRPICEDGDKIIGCFLNTVPVRINIPPHIRWQDYILKIEREILELRKYERMSLLQVLRVIGENMEAENPLFDTMFNFVDFHIYNQAEPGIGIEYANENDGNDELSLQSFGITNTLLDMNIMTTSGNFLLSFSYDHSILSGRLIKKLYNYFKRVLGKFINESECGVVKQDVMPEQEKHDILYTFNDIEAEYPADKTIHQLFEEQVKRTPDHIVLVGQSARRKAQSEVENRSALCAVRCAITYRELDEKSHQFACLLREKGVLRDNIVAIMMERSLEMIIGILGILRAGGAYLPIEPDYPQERISYILKDSKAKILVTSTLAEEGEKVRRYEGKKNLQIVLLDFSTLLPFYPSTLPSSHPHLHQSLTPTTSQAPVTSLAYVIFTSGSSGRPKGCLLEHRSVVNTIWHRWKEYRMNPADKTLQLLYYSFDGFVTDFFTPVICGASVVLPDDEERKDLGWIRIAIINNQITHLLCTPALYQAIITDLTPKEAASLKVITLAGDRLSPELPEITKRKNSLLELSHEYGVTECAVMSTLYRHQEKDNQIKIGQPTANTHIFILDENQQLQPIGIPGEIIICGVGVARGYLNNPELTTERFYFRRPGGRRLAHGALRTANIWTRETSTKNFLLEGTRGLAPLLYPPLLYRTGDLGRWLPDGNIEFLGRIDHQVKIRGFRIELGEIESILINHHEIKKTVVLALENEEGYKDLCAYIVTDRSEEMDTRQLQTLLSRKLPDYMTPSYFVQLDEIPLLPNGKIDRKALPEPKIKPGEEYEPPKNELEEKLTEIWKDVLRAKKISAKDNFFTLGGDSIKAMQIAARLQRCNLKLDVKNIFRYPTIRALRESGTIKDYKNKAEQGIITGQVILSPIQKWFFEKKIKDMNLYNHSVLLYSKLDLKENILRKVFREIATHHDALRMIFKKEETGFVQVNRGIESNLLDFHVYDLKEKNEFITIIENEAKKIQNSMELSKGPLLKVGLFKTGDGDYIFVVVHHLVTDGVSWRILFEDLVTGYRQAAKGEKITLPLKTTSFKEWSQKLTAYSTSKHCLIDVAYWSNLLEIENISLLPKDSTANENQMDYQKTLSKSLSQEKTGALLKDAHQAYNTEINDILLTALGLTVKDRFGKEKVLIDLEGHGREEILEGIDITRTIGWFTSTYPVVIDLKGEGDISLLVRKIKETLRRIPVKGMSYGILKYLTPEKYKKGVNFKLKPEISFNYLGEFNRNLDNELFEISPISPGHSINTNIESDYTLNINGIVIDGQLRIDVTYNTREYKENTIWEFLGSYQENLEKIVDHCIHKDNTELTLSDFSTPDLKDEEYNTIVGQLESIFS